MTSLNIRLAYYSVFLNTCKSIFKYLGGFLSEGYKDRYYAYLVSPQWSRKRQLVLDRCGGICERCGWADATEIHHITYKRVFNELLPDLLGVCSGCHDFLGGYSQVDPKKFGEDWISLYQAKLKEIH
jgi:hypothetical protein